MTDTPVSTGSAGGSRRTGLSGSPETVARWTAGHRWAVVDRLAAAVADSAQPAVADRYPQRFAAELHPGARGAHARGALQHLDDREVAVDLEHLAVAHRAVSERDRDELVPADPVDTGDHHQWSAQFADGRVVDPVGLPVTGVRSVGR